MKIAENLKFQREYFPNVYSKYFDNTSDEFAITKEETIYEGEKNIQIVCDSILDILTDVFKVSKDIIETIELKDYDEIHLVKDINESVDDYGKILKIRCLYPYILKVENVVVTTRVKKVKEDNFIQIYNLKKLDIFEKKYLKDISYKVKDIDSLDILCTELSGFKSKYKLERLFLGDLKKEEYIEDKQIGEDYKEMIISDLVKIVVNSDDKRPNIIVRDLIIFTNEKYEKTSLSIIKTFISDDFLNNFKVVDIYMKHREELKNMLDIKTIKELEKYIKDIKKLKKSEQISLLVGGKIKNINDILVRILSSLVNDLSKVGEEI